MKINGKEITTNLKCPTCGHIHPNGMGIMMCLCEDCALIHHRNPSVLAPEYAKRRDELMEKVREHLEAEHGE